MHHRNKFKLHRYPQQVLHREPVCISSQIKIAQSQPQSNEVRRLDSP